MCLPPAYGWAKEGRAHQHRVPTRRGRQGRANLLGTLRLEGEERLEYRLSEGPCRTKEVVGYLDALAEEAGRTGKPTVVVLDNAPSHKAGAVREREPGWEERLRLYRSPAYCRRLNPIEGVWRRLEGSLMPRRYYDSLAELKQAVVSALSLLGAVEVQSQVGGTYYFGRGPGEALFRVEPFLARMSEEELAEHDRGVVGGPRGDGAAQGGRGHGGAVAPSWDQRPRGPGEQDRGRAAGLTS